MGWRQVEKEAQGPKMLSTMSMETDSGVVSDNNNNNNNNGTSSHHSQDSRLFKREVSSQQGANLTLYHLPISFGVFTQI